MAISSDLNHHQIKEIIFNAVKWLKNHQQKNGHFHYEYNPFWDRYTFDDNMVRQAGTFYSLSEVALQDKENKLNLKENLLLTADYLVSQSQKFQIKNSEVLALKKSQQSVTTGGTGLTLVGLINLVEVFSDEKSKYSEKIELYKNFLHSIKLKNNGFANNFLLDSNSFDEESDYANGEAFLALTKYFIQTKDPKTKMILDDSWNYFQKKYSETPDNKFYLWGMTAINLLNKFEKKNEYIEFAQKYTDQRMQPYKNAHEEKRNLAAFLEGIVFGYSVFMNEISQEEKNKYLEEINFWLAKTSEFQAKNQDEIYLKFMPDHSQVIKIQKPELAEGGFFTGFSEPYQRIDFTQHCICAYLQKLTGIDGAKF